MGKYPLRISEEFIYGLSSIHSQRVLDQIRNTLDLLKITPEIGSLKVRQSLIDRYGDGIRKIPISTFIVVYRFHGAEVDILALVYGPSVK